MKKALQLIFAAAMLFTAGCKLDAPDFSKSGDPGSTASGDSYQPVSKGSYWKFNEVIAGATVTETQTVTGTTVTFDGKAYHAVNGVSAAYGSITAYYYHGNGDYILRNSAGGVIVEYLYLKDNYDGGKTWTAPINKEGSLNSVPARVTGKIIEKDISRDISGKKFINIIHTQVVTQYNYGNGFEDVQTQDYYIAKGIGIVEADSKTTGFGLDITSTSVVTDYSIK